jgi:glycosyltransferase involved in cell wall biosynthesis
MSRHVVLFIPDFSLGGAERVALNLLEALPTSDLRVTLLVNRETGPLRASVPAGSRLISLEANRTIAAFPRLVRFLRRETPDALISFLSFNNIIAVWACALAGSNTKVIATVHAPVSQEAASTAPMRKYRLMPYLYKVTLPRADHVIVVSQGVGRDLQASVSNALPFSVIGNPLVTDRLIQFAREDLTHPWFAPNAPPVILGVGRFVHLKNFALLIDAFARLATVTPARLVLLGDGPLRQDLLGLIDRHHLADRAILLPTDPNPYRYMARAGVLVLSSLYEGFGNVLVEAMATGTPVVSVDCPHGPAEILGGGRWGRLVRGATPETLAAAIEATLHTGHEPRDLRERAMQFSSTSIALKYHDLLQCLWAGDRVGGKTAARAPA